jgi:hypothetical protein
MPNEESLDYTITIEISVTAESFEEAAAFALDDIRDRRLGPWNMNVKNVGSGETEEVSVTHADADEAIAGLEDDEENDDSKTCPECGAEGVSLNVAGTCEGGCEEEEDEG